MVVVGRFVLFLIVKFKGFEKLKKRSIFPKFLGITPINSKSCTVARDLGRVGAMW